jgi:hypothetical protein
MINKRFAVGWMSLVIIIIIHQAIASTPYGLLDQPRVL